MDWNQVEGNWRQLKGSAKAQWGKLTDADLMQIEGRREQLEGKIQERYGYTKERDLRESAGELSSQIDAIRADLQSLTSTVARLASKQIDRAQDTAVEAVQQADQAIRRNPLNAIAIALALGFLFGAFTRR